MKTLNFARPLLAAALALACIFPAQGANYQKLAGNNIDFYYDADAYGLGGVTVNGNTLDIAIHLDLYGKASFNGQMNNLIAVPHAGFGVGVTPTMVMSGTYETYRSPLSPGNEDGGAYALVAQNAMFGTFSDGQFVARAEVDDVPRTTVAVQALNLYNGQPGVQEYTLTSVARGYWLGDIQDDFPQWSTSAVSYASYFDLFDGGLGRFNTIVSATATGGKWIFDAQAISAVPEPGRVAMSLAGLALMGFALRRQV